MPTYQSIETYRGFVYPELLALGTKSIRFIHRMYDSESGDEIAVTELVGVYFDTTVRASTERPAFVRERAEVLRRDSADELRESQ